MEYNIHDTHIATNYYLNIQSHMGVRLRHIELKTIIYEVIRKIGKCMDSLTGKKLINDNYMRKEMTETY